MSYDIVIKGGIIVNFDREFVSDVGIKDGKITAVGKDLKSGEAKVVDAKGKFVMPGGVDPHVHMELPFMGTVSKDDFYTGTRAALSGGTTMLMDFAIPGKQGSLMDTYKDYRKRADAKVCMDYGIHMGVSSWDEKSEKEMTELVKNHGINSFKFFMAYKGALMVNDVEIINILKCAKKIGAIAQVHCENGDMVAEGQKKMLQMDITGPEGHPLSRPPSVEAEATARICRMAEFVGCPLYIVHVMCKEAMEEVMKAKLRGQRIIGETLCAAITLDDSKVFDKNWETAAKYIMSPPLRPKGHQCAMIKALKNGIIDLIGTDHCAFDMEQRKMGKDNFTKIPNGLNGIEDRMNICWTKLVESGIMSRKDYVRVTSTEAAQIFNIYPQKGFIGVGSDADIAIMNPNVEKVVSVKTHHQNIDYNVFEGFKCKGVVDVTISRGKVVWENGKLTVEKGAGKFVPTLPYGKLFDGLEKQEKTFNELEYIKCKRGEKGSCTK